MYNHVPPYLGDPILSLMEVFMADKNPVKANLSIGLYYDANGKIPVLSSVRKARDIVGKNDAPYTYLPMEGRNTYRTAIQKLVFGEDCPALAEGRIATIHSLGGSGAIRVGADFIKAQFPNTEFWISDPTWDNHSAIISAAGFKVHTYPYYDPETNGVAFDGMLALFNVLPAQSAVLLQPCCHNPTGLDLTMDQWKQIVEVFKERNLIPFLDTAYQGFGDGVKEDSAVVRMFADSGLPAIVSNSFSKNFSLYGERVGGLSFVCPTQKEAELVLGQLKLTVRKIYSSPAITGSAMVDTVLSTPELKAEWIDEVTDMRVRIKDMRTKIRDTLTKMVPGQDFEYFTKQRGMFSYTGLSAEEVESLRVEDSVYLIRSGRMCVAGLNDSNIDHVARSMAKVFAARK